jgi:hypothetical protein
LFVDWENHQQSTTNYQQSTINHQLPKNTMTTHFITAEINLQETPTELQKAIEAELKKQGEPLRWAITSVDVSQQKATVEAVVTKQENQETTNQEL